MLTALAEEVGIAAAMLIDDNLLGKRKVRRGCYVFSVGGPLGHSFHKYSTSSKNTAYKIYQQIGFSIEKGASGRSMPFTAKSLPDR